MTVRANSGAGSVTVTTDGVRVIQEGHILDGTLIKDGLGCDQENSKSLINCYYHSYLIFFIIYYYKQNHLAYFNFVCLFVAYLQGQAQCIYN